MPNSFQYEGGMKDQDQRHGVYRITCMVTGRFYIGKADQSTFAQRWRDHKSSLNRGDHANPGLQEAWNEHGPDAFDFDPFHVVEDDSDVNVHALEVFYIKEARADNPEMLFNLLDDSNLSPMLMDSPEIRHNHREAIRTAQADPEWRRRQSIAIKATMDDPERRAIAIQALETARACPAARENHRKAVIRGWQDPNRKLLQAQSLEARRGEPDFEENRKAAAKSAMRAIWDDPEKRAARIAAITNGIRAKKAK